MTRNEIVLKIFEDNSGGITVQELQRDPVGVMHRIEKDKKVKWKKLSMKDVRNPRGSVLLAMGRYADKCDDSAILKAYYKRHGRSLCKK